MFDGFYWVHAGRNLLIGKKLNGIHKAVLEGWWNGCMEFEMRWVDKSNCITHKDHQLCRIAEAITRISTRR